MERNPVNVGDVMLNTSPLSACGCIPCGVYQTKMLEVISSNIQVNKMAKSTLEVVDE
jgi:hypothetical protein